MKSIRNGNTDIIRGAANQSDNSCVDNNQQSEGKDDEEEGYVRTAAQNYGKNLRSNRTILIPLLSCLR